MSRPAIPRLVKIGRARTMRKAPTEAEGLAWEYLRNRRCLGFKFRRQHVLHGFIADFYCVELRLVLEIDGPIHHRREIAEYDLERTRILERHGLQVVRLGNADVSPNRLHELIGAVVSCAT